MIRGNWFIRIISVLALVLVVTLMASVSSCSQEKETSEKIEVVVTILPLADFVENVGREKVDITIMVPPGANIHIYEPTPSQMAALARAEIYAKVGSGVEFELVRMDKLVAINKEMLVIDCSKGINLLKTVGEHEGKQEKEELEPSAIDPHIWMSPLNVKIMVQNIYEGLVQVDPENRVYYEQNRDAYLQELTKLDQGYQGWLIQSDQPDFHGLSSCLRLFRQRLQPHHATY